MVRTTALVVLCVGALAICAHGSEEADPSLLGKIDGGVYVDVGYLHSSNRPTNNTWRSKGTSAFLDEIRLNNITAFAYKTAEPGSAWGFSVGVQSGKDIDNLVSLNAGSSADIVKRLYNTYATYLFDVGDGLVLTGGIISGHLGYESFHGIDNPTYTRTYAVDYTPFFHLGISATYTHSPSVSGALYIINGYDYLASPNDVPSYGLTFDWKTTDDLDLAQKFYYGPEQDATALEYWRFVSNTVAEWRVGDFLVAGGIGIGTEKQASLPGTPRFDWAWGAVWFQWQARERWRLGVRPELFRDEDGLMSGARQTIGAITGTLEYRLSELGGDLLSLRLEYRFDRSTGPDGGFYEGELNELTPNQHLFIATVLWRFDSGS